MKRITQVIVISFFASLLGSCGTKQPKKETSVEKPISTSQIFKKSIDSLTVLIRKDPQNDTYFSERSNAYFLLQNLDSAINDIEIANRLAPDKMGYLLRRADMEIMRGQVVMAKTALTKIIQRYPTHLEANLKLANLYMITEEYIMSRNILNMIIKSEENNTQALLMRAMVSDLEGDSKSAIEDLMKVVTIDPKFYEAQNYLGLLYSNEREDIAIDFFNNAINLRPHDIEPRYNLGMYYQETGREQQALNQYFAILNEIDSLALDPLFNIGYIYQDVGQQADAIKYFEKAAKYYPYEARIFYRLGLSYQLLGDKENAIKYYDKTLEIEPDFDLAFDALEKLTRK